MDKDAGIQCDSQSKQMQEKMTKKLHVCNISKNVSKRDLKRVLSAYGEVDCKFLQKEPSTTFAFVVFDQLKDAEKAVNASNNKEITLNGRCLILSYFKSKRANYKHKMDKLNKKKQPRNKTVEEEIIGDALIDMLDNDCLLKIFMYLPVQKRLELEQVCTRWKDVSEQAWHDIKTLNFPNPEDVVSAPEYTKKPYFEDLIKRCGRYLISLNLSTPCSSFIYSVRDHCHNLIKLKLDFTKCYFRHFEDAFSSMEKLEIFEITNLKPQFSGDCLRTLPPTIKKIHMSMIPTKHIFNFSYKFLPRNTPNTLLKFNALTSLTLNGYILQKNVVQVLKDKQLVEYLDLAHCEFRSKGLMLLTNLVNLEHLDLDRVFTVDDKFLSSLSTKCQKIKYLNVSHCIKITNKGITELSKLENLETLLVNNMGNSVTDDVFGRMRMLKTLECEYCIGINDPGIIKLLKMDQNLERLCLAGTSVTENTLLCAANVTKTRQNNLRLHLYVDYSVTENFDSFENVSPLLSIVGKNVETFHDDDDDFDDDSDDLFDASIDDDIDDDDQFDFYYNAFAHGLDEYEPHEYEQFLEFL